MRVAFGLIGLALSVVAIGACEEPPGKDADALGCMAFLALQATAISEGRASGDAAALDTRPSRGGRSQSRSTRTMSWSSITPSTSPCSKMYRRGSSI